MLSSPLSEILQMMTTKLCFIKMMEVVLFHHPLLSCGLLKILLQLVRRSYILPSAIWTEILTMTWLSPEEPEIMGWVV